LSTSYSKKESDRHVSRGETDASMSGEKKREPSSNGEKEKSDGPRRAHEVKKSGRRGIELRTTMMLKVTGEKERNGRRTSGGGRKKSGKRKIPACLEANSSKGEGKPPWEGEGKKKNSSRSEKGKALNCKSKMEVSEAALVLEKGGGLPIMERGSNCHRCLRKWGNRVPQR